MFPARNRLLAHFRAKAERQDPSYQGKINLLVGSRQLCCKIHCGSPYLDIIAFRIKFLVALSINLPDNELSVRLNP